MDFLDNAIDNAKEVMDIAYKKTNEVVNTGKQKFDGASLQNKRSKDFEKLGEINYNLIKDTEIEDGDIKVLVDEINRKSAKIAEIKQELNNAKCKRICPACGAAIDENAVFCQVCGIKLTFEE